MRKAALFLFLGSILAASSFNKEQYDECYSHVHSSPANRYYRPYHVFSPFVSGMHCFAEDFLFGKVLSRNDKTAVYRARHRHAPETPLIIKMFPAVLHSLGNDGNEECILGAITHPRIPRLNCAFRMSDADGVISVALVMAEAPGIPLIDLVLAKHLAGRTRDCHLVAYELLLQIAPVIHFLHQNNIAHRDVKLENVIIDPANSQMMLIDFDLAFLTLSGELPQLSVGSDGYKAPEMIDVRRTPSFSVDWFSLGVSVYAAATGLFPFNPDSGPLNYLKDVEKGCPAIRPCLDSESDAAVGEFWLSLLPIIIRGLLKSESDKRWNYWRIQEELNQT